MNYKWIPYLRNRFRIVLRWTIVGIPLDASLLIAKAPVIGVFTFFFMMVGVIFAFTEG